MTPLKLMHLSDIHFGRGFSDLDWNVLRELAKTQEVGALLCTGDLVNHGGIAHLAMARRELEAFAQSIGAALYVIPGNHDMSIAGFIPFPGLAGNFRFIFSCPSSLLSGLPTYSQFKTLSPIRRFAMLVETGAKLYWKRLRGTTSPIPKPLCVFQGSIVLAQLDSNAHQQSATGRVAEQELKQVADQVESLQGFTALLPRVALVHHHPVSIPFADLDESKTNNERSLMLRNAGTVARALCRADFDLILHGHKHYPGYARVGYDVSGVRRLVTVLASGSAALSKPEPQSNAVNIIEVFPSGLIRYAIVKYYKGQFIAECPNALEQDAYPLDELKQRQHRRALAITRASDGEVLRYLEIDDEGTARFSTKFVGSMIRAHGVELPPVRINVSRGSVAVDHVRIQGLGRHRGLRAVPSDVQSPRHLRYRLDLQGTLQPNVPIDYEVSYVSFATFSLTEWEEQVHAQEDEEKNMSFSGFNSLMFAIRRPTDKLVLQVKLPKTFVGLEAQLRVFHPKDRSALLSGSDQAIRSQDLSEDRVLSHLESKNLHVIDSHSVMCSIDMPLPGYIYQLTWPVRSIEDRPDSLHIPKVLALRAAFLEAANTPHRLQELLAIAVQSAKTFSIALHSSSREDVRVALFVYDARRRRVLGLVEGASQSTPNSLALELPIGVGLAGICFKRRRPFWYLDPAIGGIADDGAILSGPAPDFKVAVAIPFSYPTNAARGRHPWPAPAPQETIGVLSIVSTYIDSPLVSIAKQVRRPGSAGSTDARDFWEAAALSATQFETFGSA